MNRSTSFGPATTGRPDGCPLTPEGAVPLAGERFRADPAVLYRDLRNEHGPVVPVLLIGDLPAWLVLGYRELHHVTSDPALFSRDARLWNQWEAVPPDWPLLPMIGRGDEQSIYWSVGEAHRRHAVMVNDALESVDPFELRRHAETLADELIDRFCGRGRADLVSQYAMQLPVLVLARIFGFPDSEGHPLMRAMNALADGGADANDAQQRFAAAITRLVAAKRERPGADVASWMLAHPGFTDTEYVYDLMALTAAGHLPTADWIGNSLRLMLTDDRFAASLGGGRHSVGEAMNEVLWEDTPTQILAGRWASRDTQLGGRHIRTGDMLLLGLGAANADPQVRSPGPGAGTFTGGNNAFFSFSHGEHRCPFPAQEIAEVIARTGIEVILDRLPDVELSVPPQTLVRRPSPFLRGMSELPVQFAPTPATGGTR